MSTQADTLADTHSVYLHTYRCRFLWGRSFVWLSAGWTARVDARRRREEENEVNEQRDMPGKILDTCTESRSYSHANRITEPAKLERDEGRRRTRTECTTAATPSVGVKEEEERNQRESVSCLQRRDVKLSLSTPPKVIGKVSGGRTALLQPWVYALVVRKKS